MKRALQIAQILNEYLEITRGNNNFSLERVMQMLAMEYSAD